MKAAVLLVAGALLTEPHRIASGAQVASDGVPKMSIDEIDPYEGRMVRVCGTVKDTAPVANENARVLDLKDTGTRIGSLVVTGEARKLVEPVLSKVLGARVCVVGIARSTPEYRAVYADDAKGVEIVGQSPAASQPLPAPAYSASPTTYTDSEAATILVQLQEWFEGRGPKPTVDYSRLTPTQRKFFIATLNAAASSVPAPTPPHPSSRSDQTAQLLLRALEGFNAGFQTAPAAPVYTPGYTKRSRIDRVSSGGEVITLLDGSVWIVHELDRLKSSLWLFGEVAVVKGSRYGEYLLVRTDRGDSVRVTSAR